MPTIGGDLTTAERHAVQEWLNSKVRCVCGQRMELHRSPLWDRHTYAEPYLPVRSVLVVCKSCARVEALDPDVMGLTAVTRPPRPPAKAKPSSRRAAVGGEAGN